MNISTELLAAYVEGKVSSEERLCVRKYLATNPELIPSVLYAMDDEQNIPVETLYNEKKYLKNLNSLLEKIRIVSELADTNTYSSAANNTYDNLCVIRCEGFVLRHFGKNISDEELIDLSVKEGWLQPEGVIYSNIGKLSQRYGLNVVQIKNGTFSLLEESIKAGYQVIVFIDSSELTGSLIKEKAEDLFVGSRPDHAVIVNSITKDGVRIIDSVTTDFIDTYSSARFIDSWEDSNKFMVIIKDN